MQLDVVNSNNEKVGARRRPRRRVRRAGERRSDLGVGRARERGASAGARTRRRTARSSAAAARSRGGRRAPAARASARSAIRCGGRAARCSGRSRAATSTSCRRRWSAARCARRSPQKLQDGELVVVDALRGGRDQDEGGGGDAEAARASTGKAVIDRRRAGREAGAVGAQHARRALLPSDRVTARDVSARARGRDAGRVEKLQEALARASARRTLSQDRVAGIMNHETHRRHPPAADHREDVASSAKTGGRSCSRWRRTRTRSRSSAPSSSCSASKVANIRTEHRARQDQAAGALRRPAVRTGRRRT